MDTGPWEIVQEHICGQCGKPVVPDDDWGWDTERVAIALWFQYQMADPKMESWDFRGYLDRWQHQLDPDEKARWLDVARYAREIVRRGIVRESVRG